MRKNEVTIHIPVVAPDQTVNFIDIDFSARRGAAQQEADDKDVNTIVEDFWFTQAWWAAKSGYLHLMNSWRFSPRAGTGKAWKYLAFLLTKPAQKWKISTPTACALTVDNSAQLGFLLGMLFSHHHIDIKHIFATGQVITHTEGVIIERIEHIKNKLKGIFAVIDRMEFKKNENVLIAFPQGNLPEIAESLNLQEKINTINQEKEINIICLPLDDIDANLKTNKILAKLRHYPLSFFYPILIFISLFTAYLTTEFFTPIYVTWNNPDNRPLTKDSRGHYQYSCETLLGNPQVKMGDFLEVSVKADDNSVWQSITKTQMAMVFVGEKSGVRVEKLPAVNGNQNEFLTIYSLYGYEEAFLIAAIAKRGFEINRGELNVTLTHLIQNSKQFDRLSTVEGYLDANYPKVASYRYLLVSSVDCED